MATISQEAHEMMHNFFGGFDMAQRCFQVLSTHSNPEEMAFTLLIIARTIRDGIKKSMPDWTDEDIDRTLREYAELLDNMEKQGVFELRVNIL